MSLSTGANVQFRCTIIDIETKIQRLYGFEYPITLSGTDGSTLFYQKPKKTLQ